MSMGDRINGPMKQTHGYWRIDKFWGYSKKQSMCFEMCQTLWQNLKQSGIPGVKRDFSHMSGRHGQSGWSPIGRCSSTKRMFAEYLHQHDFRVGFHSKPFSLLFLVNCNYGNYNYGNSIVNRLLYLTIMVITPTILHAWPPLIREICLRHSQIFSSIAQVILQLCEVSSDSTPKSWKVDAQFYWLTKVYGLWSTKVTKVTWSLSTSQAIPNKFS
jgi:hypothetical protein